jgi:threonine/homoserine/homoserine lactone efflux protein
MIALPNATLLSGFIVAALVVLLIPGPGVLYIVTRSLSQGRRAGLVSVLGLSAGALAHVAAATAGLSAILLASATAFGAVKTLGAAYLIYLGVRTLLSVQTSDTEDVMDTRSRSRLFADGVVVSVLNPKIAVFFLAFLPQFVDPARGPVATQIFTLGLLYVMLALVTDGMYAVLAGSVRSWIDARFMRGPVPRYASGAVYIGLGVSTALSGKKQ